MKSVPHIWVETPHFQIEPGEDAHTNPGVYGCAFSQWLAEQLRARGQTVLEVLPEDWGWCLILMRKPFRLWIGCSNRADRIDEWGAFVIAEPTLWQRLFRAVDTAPEVLRLHALVNQILQTVPGLKAIHHEERR